MISERIFSYAVHVSIEDIFEDIKSSTADTLFLIFPRNTPLFAQKTDLQKIRDFADESGKNITIVTLNARARKEIESIGLSTLSSLSDREKTPFEKARSQFSETKKISYIPIDTSNSSKAAKKENNPTPGVARPTLHALFIFCIIVFLLFLFIIQIAVPGAEIHISPAKKEEEMHINVNLLDIEKYEEENLWEYNNGIFMTPLESVFLHNSSFVHVSKDFYGENASGVMSIVNNSSEDITLRKGTRLTHAQGLTITLPQWIKIPKQSAIELEMTFPGKDIYGSMIGEKGNMKSGERWIIPGLSEEMQVSIYGEITQDFTGGKTGWKYRITEEDIEKAKQAWTEEAKIKATEEINILLQSMREEHPEKQFLLLTQNSEFLEIEILEYFFETDPQELINKEQGFINGGLKIRVKGFTYSFEYLESAFYTKYQKIAPDGMSLISLNKDLLTFQIQGISKDFSHIESSFSTRGIYSFQLEPQSPHTQRFFVDAKKLILGTHEKEAEQLLLNSFIEISDVSIKLSPFWVTHIPILPEKVSFILDSHE